MSEKELKVQQKQEVQQAGEPTKPEKQFLPAVDIYENDAAVIVVAEMPGTSKEALEINLEDGVLTIKGATKEEKIAGETWLHREFESGQYIRKFTVAETIDQGKIKAAMADGLLTVTLPKIEPVKPKKIEVTVG